MTRGRSVAFDVHLKMRRRTVAQHGSAVVEGLLDALHSDARAALKDRAGG
jgi:hypothetical protein